MTSSVVTSQKWNLRFQIGQVLQFCIHRISAKYHILRLHTFEGETFESFNVLIGHRGVAWLVTMEKLSPKYFWNQILLLLSVSETYLKRKQSYSPKNSKHFCAYNAPTESVGRSYWKKPQCFNFSIHQGQDEMLNHHFLCHCPASKAQEQLSLLSESAALHAKL